MGREGLTRVFIPFTQAEKDALDPEEYEEDGVEEAGRLVPDLINTPADIIRDVIRVAVRTIYGDQIDLKTKELIRLDANTWRFICERKQIVPGTTVCSIVAYDSGGYIYSQEMDKCHLNRHDGLDITLNLPIPALC